MPKPSENNPVIDQIADAEGLAMHQEHNPSLDLGNASLYLQLALGAGLALQGAVTNLNSGLLVSLAANAELLAQAVRGDRSIEEIQKALSLSQANVEGQIANLESIGKKAVNLLYEASRSLFPNDSGR